MTNLDQAFFDRHERRFLVLHCDIEYCSANRNHSCRRDDTIVVRLAAQLLNVDLHPPSRDQEDPSGSMDSPGRPRASSDTPRMCFHRTPGKSAKPSAPVTITWRTWTTLPTCSAQGLESLRIGDLAGQVSYFGGNIR